MGLGREFVGLGREFVGLGREFVGLASEDHHNPRTLQTAWQHRWYEGHQIKEVGRSYLRYA